MQVETAGLVLAAGGGSRYGMPKALVRYAGELLVDRAARTLREAGAAPRLVILGAQAERVRSAAPDLPWTVLNPAWASGLGSSLRTGLLALSGTTAQAAVVLLADMPEVSAAAVRRLLEVTAPDALAMGGYDDRRGHPVLLGRTHWPGILETATGDRGARDYLRAHATEVRVVPVGDVAGDLDLDVPELNPYATQNSLPSGSAMTTWPRSAP